jgi:hypothetical protein
MANISSNMVNKFEAEVVSANINMSSLIQDAITWMNYNLSPADVFDAKDLEAWAEENGYSKNSASEE